MGNIPKSAIIFRKPDHFSLLIGFGIIVFAIISYSASFKIIGTIFLIFTACYELFEIFRGKSKHIIKLDHITFVIGLAILLGTFVYDSELLLIIATTFFGFTLSYEIYFMGKKIQRHRKRSF